MNSTTVLGLPVTVNYIVSYTKPLNPIPNIKGPIVHPLEARRATLFLKEALYLDSERGNFKLFGLI